MNRHRSEQSVIGCAAVMMVASLCGCQDSRRHETTEDVALPAAELVVDANVSPKQVVQGLLVAISQAQTIRAKGLQSTDERKSYDHAFGRIRGFSAEEAIYERLKRQAGRSSIPHDIGKNAALKLTIENWISISAHYAGGFLLDDARVSSPDPETGIVMAYVEAERPEDAQRLRAIESLPEVQQEREKSGAVGTKVYQDYIRLVRAKALAQGFNYPIRARFRLLLKKAGDTWRVEYLDFAPLAPPGFVQPPPTTPAAPPTQPSSTMPPHASPTTPTQATSRPPP